jgi:hypothetical protein
MSPHSPVVDPYTYGLESNPSYLYLYTDPNLSWNRTKYSFSSSTSEPAELIRQDEPPTAINETTPPPAHATPPERPMETVPIYVPLNALAKVSAAESPIPGRAVARRERARGLLYTLGNTPLDLKPTSCAQEVQVSIAQTSNTRIHFEKLDGNSRPPIPAPFRSVMDKSHLSGLERLVVGRNPYAIKPRNIQDNEIEMECAAIKTEPAPELTASAKDHGHRPDSGYARVLTSTVEARHSLEAASISSGSLDLDQIRHGLHSQFLSDEIRADDGGGRVDEVSDDAQQTSPEVDSQDRRAQGSDAETLQDTSATRIIQSGHELHSQLPVCNDNELHRRYSYTRAMSRIYSIIGELAVQLRDLNSEVVAIGGTDPRRALTIISLIEQVQGILLEITGGSASAPTPATAHDQAERHQSNGASEAHITPPEESQEMLEAITNWGKLREAKRDAANGDPKKAVRYLDELVADIEKICLCKAKFKTCETCVTRPPEDRGEFSGEQEGQELNKGISQTKEGPEANQDLRVDSNTGSNGSHGNGTTTGSNQPPSSAEASGQPGSSGFPTWVNGLPFVDGRPFSNDLPSLENFATDPDSDPGLKLLLDHDARPIPSAKRNSVGIFSIIQSDNDQHFFTMVQPNDRREVFLNLPPGFSVTPNQNFDFVFILAPVELPSSTPSEIEEHNERHRLEEEEETNAPNQEAPENPSDIIVRPITEDAGRAVDRVDETNREPSPTRSITAPAPGTFWNARRDASGQPYLEQIDREEADRLEHNVDRAILQMGGPDAIVHGAHVWRPGEDAEMDRLWDMIRKKWNGRTVRDV